MQPSATASIPPPTEMDLQAMQSMSWLFKKENFFNLAQFYQHTSALKDKDIAELKGQVANLENKLESNMDRHNFENEISLKEKQISQLVEELQRREATIAKLHENYSKLSLLEEQLDQKNQYIAKLEAKLDSQKDYDDIKRELTILKSANQPILPEKSLDFLLERTKQEQPKSPIQENEGEHPPPTPQSLPMIQTPYSDSSQSQRLPVTTPPVNAPLPPPFQNVETFGTILGEEIVANWRRSIEQMSLTSRIMSTTPTDAGGMNAPAPATLMDVTEKSTASTPQPMDGGRQSSPLLNGNPKSPEDNNNHHVSNNNIPLSATVCAVNNFLKAEDIKSPYRFEEHRSFRFAEDLGMPPGSMVGRLGESLIPKGDPMEARLQEMLRFNMDKYASQNLDTLHISRRVRELLSIHNIGQRLFAKYILGLSQGTVSELLSKPKPWDKLTEKGRDSYRKMHAWSCDDNAVLLLKSLIPKKDNFSSGKESGMPTFGRPDQNDYNDDRIAHILNEASQMHSKNVEDTHSNEDSKSPHGCPSPFSKDSSQNRKLKKYENDDIPQEKVARIYQEEMAKLMGRRIEDMRNSRDIQSMFLPQLFSGAPMERSQEDVRAFFDAYHQLAKINPCPNPQLQNLGLLALHQQAMVHQNPSVNGGAQDLSLPKEKSKMVNGTDDKDKDDDVKHNNSAFSLVRPKLEAGTPQTTSSTASSPLGNSILPPAMTPTEDFTGSAAASPLQRMASITNSLISQPPQQPHPTSSQRPLKAVLPPITQQQFDLYNNLNTEDIVKKVKEQLSQYSISQRLFGESVLGLSQGSVSDLLARPKPWHMLTQKGREPFIRMKMFLEDDNAVHKLVASQYKIAPEKLMRTGGYGGVPHYISACASVAKPMPSTPKMMSEAASLLNHMKEAAPSLLPPSLQMTHHSQNVPQPPPPPMLLTPPGVPPHHAISLQNQEHMKKTSHSPHGLPPTPMSQQSNMRSLHQHISPSVYEMAALTQDLDTQVITTKIKEALLANNIGQKIFGEAVLGLSQGSVSELLSKPKPWHMLSIKGREPFIRMQLWLNDAHNIDRLQALKNERREANKRRRSSGPGNHDNSSDTSSNDTSEYYHSNSPGPGPPAPKKQRVLFTEFQKMALNVAYELKNYPNQTDTDFLAAELALPDRTVSNWFHNHRMRLKPSGNATDRDQAANQPPLDPTRFRLLLNKRMIEMSQERIGLTNLPLGYPYLAANPNIAALIGRGLLQSGDIDLSALNNAVKEQISGLDLSMGSIKRESEFDDDDMDSNVGSEDSNISGSMHGEMKIEQKEQPISSQSRSSRRKPAAPQWVNPDWQDEKEKQPQTGDEVIINGVCVMQTEDYGRRNAEETIRIEPTPVMDRYEDDRSETSSISQEHDSEKTEEKQADGNEEAESKSIKEENEERWDY